MDMVHGTHANVGGDMMMMSPSQHDEMEMYDLPDHPQEGGGAGAGATTTTQLSEQFPQIDAPLRVDPPPNLKAPERIESLGRDAQIRRSAFSPGAHSTAVHHKKTGALNAARGAGLPPPRPPGGIRKKSIEATLKSFSKGQGNHQTDVAHYSMLAFSSARSGKVAMEGQAYLAMAISQDNMHQYAQAMESYRKFLDVCKRLNEPVVEGLAYNCLGVDAMLLACPPHEGSKFEMAHHALSPDQTTLLERAVGYHQSHAFVADEGGKFVAETNLGLCLGLLGDLERATHHHQEALRIAIRLQSFSGQGISVGNLGLLAMRQGELTTARACLEQHLSLVQSLKDGEAETNAWMQLGHLGNMAGDYEAAAEAYEAAAALAQDRSELGLLKRLHCSLGIAKGNASLEAHFEGLAKFAAAGYAGAAQEENDLRGGFY